MAYSFTEKKRIRKDFGKLPEIMEIPYLLSIQIDSYNQIPAAERKRRGAAGRRSARGVPFGVSDRQLFGQRGARVRRLSPGRPRVRRQGMRVARHHLRGAAARARAPDHLRPRVRIQSGQGRQRAGSVHGRNSAHDRERYVRHQRHRARSRFAAAPFARCVLRPRPRQDALVRQAAVQRPRDSLPWFLARFRIRSEGLRVRAHRPSPQAAGDDSAARARFHVRTNARDVLRDEPVSREERRLLDRSDPRAYARRRCVVRNQGQERRHHRRSRSSHHCTPRAPAREIGPASPRRAARISARSRDRARHRQSGHRRDPDSVQRDHHRRSA